MNGLWTAGMLTAVIPVLTVTQGSLVEHPAERDVMAAEAARTEAKQDGDSARLNELLAPDFIKINRFGRLLGKRQAIALARNPNYATQDLQLRIYDDGAVVTGRESDEGEAPGSVRFLRVWAHDRNQWLELADEGTQITSEPEAARVAKAPRSPVDRVIAEQPGADANHVAEEAEAPAAVARDIRQLERAYRDAERINNLTILDRLRAPEFRLVDRLGNVIPSPTSSRPTIKAVQDEDFGVRVHGNLALVIGSVVRTNLINGAMDRFRYLAVWVQRGGHWQVAAEQRTPIA
jgi:hypothetical protein